jgi:Ni/Co efflux regulator RcnB
MKRIAMAILAMSLLATPAQADLADALAELGRQADRQAERMEREEYQRRAEAAEDRRHQETMRQMERDRKQASDDAYYQRQVDLRSDLIWGGKK